MLQGEHSAILLTFIKLSFVIKIFILPIFEWLFYTGFTNGVHAVCSEYLICVLLVANGSGGKLRLWSDCADAQADPSFRWLHMPMCTFYWTPAIFDVYDGEWGPFGEKCRQKSKTGKCTLKFCIFQNKEKHKAKKA